MPQAINKLDKIPKNTLTVKVYFSWRFKLRFWLGVRLLKLLAWLWNSNIEIIETDG